MTFIEWREKAVGVFMRHIPSDRSAVAAAVAMIHALWVMQRGFFQGDDKAMPGRAAATLSVVTDLTMGLANNDFMRRHGGRVYPLFEASVRGWISGAFYNAKFAGQDGQPTVKQYDTILDAQSCTRVYRELALAIIALANNAEPTPEEAATFRAEITALMETP